ncbi:MAG: D-Ala-D-Ala carboxypeptidase family metallohydrolase [Pseudomonadota bacterium]
MARLVSDWVRRWPNFAPEEVACRGCAPDAPCRRNRLAVDPQAMDCLQALRGRIGRPLRINSAFRCPYHNKRVGGAVRSRHRYGDAFDVSVIGWRKEDKRRLYDGARGAGFNGFGLYGSFLHIDTSRPRIWSTTQGDKAWRFLMPRPLD